ncbi:MAG TPA: hypothetical protein PLA54_08475 [Spirochaetota bacterium]|nr:hypothetical protein [Spirochaetota bacterium]
MNHKFQKMLSLCRKQFFAGAQNMNVPRLRFWQELEAKVLHYQSQADGWDKFRNYIAGKGATGSTEVNKFCIILLDEMEKL